MSLHIEDHERADERNAYLHPSEFLADRHGLGSMKRGHREILHLARLLARVTTELLTIDTDRYLIRDTKRTIEALVRLHYAQEEDIYEYAASRRSSATRDTGQRR